MRYPRTGCGWRPDARDACRMVHNVQSTSRPTVTETVTGLAATICSGKPLFKDGPETPERTTPASPCDRVTSSPAFRLSSWW